MTGKEILEEEFEKAGMRGYRADQVDVFLQRVAQYVDEQENEKNDLNYKIQILADKIEEYKKDEENIREALLGAQKLGASILNEAKSKAETLTREAKTASDDMLAKAKSKVDSLTKDSLQKANQELASIKRDCDVERRRLEMMKQEVSSFRASILKQYKQHLDLLSNLPSVEEKPESRPAVSYNSRPVVEANSPVPNEPVSEPVLTKAEEVPATEEVPASSAEEAFPDAHPQTIKSDIVSIEDDIAEEEKEHTKEFGSEKPFSKHPSDKENAPTETSAPDFAPLRHGPRPNYIEKFGELKFNLGDKEKQ